MSHTRPSLNRTSAGREDGRQQYTQETPRLPPPSPLQPRATPRRSKPQRPFSPGTSQHPPARRAPPHHGTGGVTASWGGRGSAPSGDLSIIAGMQDIAGAGASPGDQGHRGWMQGIVQGAGARLGAAADPGPGWAGGHLATSGRFFVCSTLPGLCRCRRCHFSRPPLTYAENVVSA